MKLTKYQKEFIIEEFFEISFIDDLRDTKLNIAEKLLDNGSCIVAGHDCIWKGGIGNFINTEETKDAVDCVKYVFDEGNFFNWFTLKEVVKYKIAEKEKLVEKLKLEIKELKEL